MADEVLIVFKADTTDLDRAIDKIEQLTTLQAALRAEVSNTYSNRLMDEAIAKMEKQAAAMQKYTAAVKKDLKGTTEALKQPEAQLQKLLTALNTLGAGLAKKAASEIKAAGAAIKQGTATLPHIEVKIPVALKTEKPQDTLIQKLPPVELPVQVKPAAAQQAAAKFAAEFAAGLQQMGPLVNAIGQLTASVFAGETAALEQEKKKQLAIAGSNSQKREEIEKAFAVKAAKIARKQAEANKAIALVNIALSTAQAVAKAIEKGFPAAYADIAIAVAGGAMQAGIVSAQALPPVPAFEKGGAVVLAGGRKKNGHLFGRSHRQGGILINAQGGEYIWDIPTVKKHGDIIRAAHENRLNDLLLHKYIVPLMETKTAAAATGHYDDFMLRATIKQGHEKDRRNAEYIAHKVSSAVASSVVNLNRYS